MRPAVFIGSSREGLAAASAVREHLRRDTDVVLWSDRLFMPGQATLDVLLKSMELFDFAVLVFTADDIIESRGVAGAAPRDNVVFELGMCFGSLGPRRTFALCQAASDIKIPSDLAGVAIPRFDPAVTGGDLHAAVASECEQIQSLIRARFSQAELRLLPSTALAIGYFENFIVPVCAHGRVVIGQRTWDLSMEDFRLVIVLPADFGPTFHAGLRTFLRDQALIQVAVTTNTRDFPFYVRADADEPQLELYDVPTTLSVLPRAIRLYLGKQVIGTDEEETALQQREIANFRKALERLCGEPEHWRLKRIVQIDQR